MAPESPQRNVDVFYSFYIQYIHIYIRNRFIDIDIDIEIRNRFIDLFDRCSVLEKRFLKYLFSSRQLWRSGLI